MFQVNPLLGRDCNTVSKGHLTQNNQPTNHMKNQALFSLKDKSKK